jgi:hypothetical protein
MKACFLGMIFVAAVACPMAPAQQPLSDLFPKNERLLHGRIVLYDWNIHEFTAGDDFIIKTADAKTPYARILYKPFWGFDAPPSRPEDKLDRHAFIGVGDWTFAVRVPMSVEEKGGCSQPGASHYEDETGTHELPKYMPTPGASRESAPSVEMLPCFILKQVGLLPENTPKQ